MADQNSVMERISNWFFGIPAVAQWWAKTAAQRTNARLGDSSAIPFARLRRPLARSRVALLTTGGIHLPDQPPFDMDDADGDATYRTIPGDVALADLTITHKYYNHDSADKDKQVIFPLDHFRDLAERGVIGGIAPHHFGFMGHIEGEHLDRLVQKTAPEVAAKLRADGVDFAFLTPA
ncbi:MAG: hypothetical protein KDD84_14845 [Caldilineaceae bacterium]|nr:hypothetical protein [Caldilineaceae bacterium]